MNPKRTLKGSETQSGRRMVNLETSPDVVLLLSVQRWASTACGNIFSPSNKSYLVLCIIHHNTMPDSRQG